MRKPVLANKIVQQAPSMIKTPNHHDHEKVILKLYYLKYTLKPWKFAGFNNKPVENKPPISSTENYSKISQLWK